MLRREVVIPGEHPRRSRARWLAVSWTVSVVAAGLFCAALWEAAEAAKEEAFERDMAALDAAIDRKIETIYRLWDAQGRESAERLDLLRERRAAERAILEELLELRQRRAREEGRWVRARIFCLPDDPLCCR